MRKYKRFPTSTARVSSGRRPLRGKKRPYFFFRFILLLLVLGVLCTGGWFAVSKTYEALTQAEITNWHVKSVEVSGVDGALQEQIAALAAPYRGEVFPAENIAVLRKQIETGLPMLGGVSVSRNLLSGKLKINARLRTPVAQLMLADGTVRYLDEESVVYEDGELLSVAGDLIRIELLGAVPDQVDESFVGMVRSIIKLQKNLPFSSLRLDMDNNSVTMTLPDKSEILFAQATHLKEKAQRAADIMEYVGGHLQGPVRLDFSLFEYGKIFLTQKSN